MQITKTQKIIIGAVAIIVLLGIYIAFDRKSRSQNVPVSTDTSQTATSTTATSTITLNGSDSQTITQGGVTYKIEQVPITTGSGVPKPIPDLTRKVVFGSDVSLTPEVKAMVEQKVSGLQAELSKKPEYWAAWIDLGIYYKMAGDYDGAVISWKYARKLSPTDYISPANLGNLYAYFLKDNGQAEIYYKEAISKGPTQAYLYTQLAEVYRDIFKDLDKARAIIVQGLSKIPNDPNLLQLQASLK